MKMLTLLYRNFFDLILQINGTESIHTVTIVFSCIFVILFCILGVSSFVLIRIYFGYSIRRTRRNVDRSDNPEQDNPNENPIENETSHREENQGEIFIYITFVIK